MFRISQVVFSGLLAVAASTTVQAQTTTTQTTTQTATTSRPGWLASAPKTAQYYYLPEIKSYYDVRSFHYIVRQHGKWVRVKQLDNAQNINFRPISLKYVGTEPWINHEDNVRRFSTVAAAPVPTTSRPGWLASAPKTAQYYYLPEIKSYYDVRSFHYIVRRDGKWARVKQLNDSQSINFRPVALTYVGAEPWTNHLENVAKYPR